MRDQVALQREHLALKKERALINLQIEREKTYIEKEVTELNLLKEKLKIEKCNAHKAQLEVQMLEAKCTQSVGMTIDDYNNNVTNQ
ncbi:hypothetical protein DPMN_187737 [Dreissena polymorpha]|uniref:Uncharacterized protein n=1 Tax=Dreissena polymorpha TaxID=45954 RepID=A0A9D4DNW8_DREPO|nr:hypothetical protein DPMN_049319 [Dreissena polymorpha]KAH3753107.1 hypothetical protein DPMN_187737 [Dreissena polymorpha]